MPSGQISTSSENWLLEALAHLNQVSLAVNHICVGDVACLNDLLALIARTVTELFQGSVAAVLIYNADNRAFDLSTLITAGMDSDSFPEALAMEAVSDRQPIFSNERPPTLHLPEGPVQACYPFVASGVSIGAMLVNRRSQMPFTPAQKLVLSNLSNLSTAAILHANSLSGVHRDLARKEEELKQLRRAGLLISSRLRLEETLEAILQMALEVTNAQYGIFRLLDKNGQNLITRAIAGDRLARPLIEALPTSANTVMGWVARNRQPVCIPDLREEPWRNVYYPLDVMLEMRSELAVPLIGASGRLEGVLNLESPRVAAFTDQDSHLLQSLATQAVIAIQEVRLLDALQEVAQILLSQPNPKVLSRVVELACDLLNADASAIWILKNGMLVLQAASGSLHPVERLSPSESLAGKSLSGRRAVVVAGNEDSIPDLINLEKNVTALTVPLLAGDTNRPVGAFAIYSTNQENGRFVESEWDKKVLSCLAYYAALSVQNAGHQEALRAAQ